MFRQVSGFDTGLLRSLNYGKEATIKRV